jgi:predicted transcriptional regulator
MPKIKAKQKQNLTISLDPKTIRKAKILAARRETSISGLVAQQIESLVGQEEAYERAKRQAMALLDEGFHLGGAIRATRDELHER